MDVSNGMIEEMKERARQASGNSYCRYSRFPVGAAVLTETGDIYTGCNVENVSYGLTVCAERTAIFKAISEGHKEIQVVVVYTPTGRATPPCGACRQVINEFGPNARIVCFCDTPHRIDTVLNRLLPHAFHSL
jgi:cytidine deaminase